MVIAVCVIHSTFLFNIFIALFLSIIVFFGQSAFYLHPADVTELCGQSAQRTVVSLHDQTDHPRVLFHIRDTDPCADQWSVPGQRCINKGGLRAILQDNTDKTEPCFCLDTRHAFSPFGGMLIGQRSLYQSDYPTATKNSSTPQLLQKNETICFLLSSALE